MDALKVIKVQNISISTDFQIVKSHQTQKMGWFDKKNFKPSENSRLCSKHFKLEDFNQPDILREKLMPVTKVRINLSFGVIPTIKSETVELLPNKRDLKANRKHYIQTKSLISTNTLKISMQVENYDEINFNDISLVTDILEERINANNKSIQCDIEKESYTKLEFNDDLLFDMLLEFSDESCFSDSEADIKYGSSSQNNKFSLSA